MIPKPSAPADHHPGLPSLRYAALALLLGAAACTTTGDPTQGGLFGWSRAKAEERENELAARLDAAQQEAAHAERDRAGLNRQRDGMAAEEKRLQRELDRLTSENDDLDARLRRLMKRHGLGAAELARLQKVVSDNERLRQSLNAAAPAANPSRSAAPTLAQVSSVSDQNSRLHREILILMQP